jgi:hypothetical protein
LTDGSKKIKTSVEAGIRSPRCRRTPITSTHSRWAAPFPQDRTADEGNRIAALIEEIIENGLRGEGDLADLSVPESVRLVEPVCRHPQEGTIRHMSMDV